MLASIYLTLRLYGVWRDWLNVPKKSQCWYIESFPSLLVLNSGEWYAVFECLGSLGCFVICPEGSEMLRVLSCSYRSQWDHAAVSCTGESVESWRTAAKNRSDKDQLWVAAASAVTWSCFTLSSPRNPEARHSVTCPPSLYTHTSLSLTHRHTKTHTYTHACTFGEEKPKSREV